jgi:tRNA threonylcarbamoyladenosine biosynthesis protein TsaB
MTILTLRTDKPEAEVGIYEDDRQLACSAWHAHRELAETLHTKLSELLEKADKQSTDLDGVVVYQGPGSFTGLRIGVSVANALADSLSAPIVGTTGDDWLAEGFSKLSKGQNDKIVIPEYGSPPHITTPKH